MKEVLILLYLIISVTSNPIPPCSVCQQNPYNPPCLNPSQNNPCIQAATVQNALPNRDELNQLLMSKIMSNQCVQKILDPKLKLFNQNGDEILRQSSPNVVNNYFILPPEVFLEDAPKKRKVRQKVQNDVLTNTKKKARVERKQKPIKNSAKLIKPAEVEQDENQDGDIKKVKSGKKKSSRKRKNVKSTKTDIPPVLDPVKNNEEENLSTNKKKRKKNRKPKGAKSGNSVTQTDVIRTPEVDILENKNHQLQNIESPIDNFEVTKDLLENKQLARNSIPDFSWPQNVNAMPEDVFNGFYPYMDMSNYFSPYGNYPFDFGQFYQPNYPRKRKNRRKYDNNNGEPHVLEIKLKPKDENNNSSKINPNTHVLQIKLKPKNKHGTELSTENLTDENYAEIELQLDPTDLEQANLAAVTELTEENTEVVEIPQNEAVQEYEESLDSLEIMEEEPTSAISIEEKDEGQENDENVNHTPEFDIKIDLPEDIVPDSIEIDNVEILEEPKTISEEHKKADIKEVKIEFDNEELQNSTPELGKEEKVPTMYSNGIINDYYPIFYDDAFYASEENNYHLKDLDDRLFYVTEGKEETFNRDRRKYDKYDYNLPNNIEERMKQRRNFINNMKNYDGKPKLGKNEENFQMPPLLENPGFVSRKIETKPNLDEYDRPFYISKYPEAEEPTKFDVNSSKDIETVFARSKVVKYGAVDSKSEEDLNASSDSASAEKAYVVTARSMGPVEDFYWK